MAKKPAKTDMIGWLDYGLECVDAAWRNDTKGMRLGSSMSGDRARERANRFDAKATEAFDKVRIFLTEHGGGVLRKVEHDEKFELVHQAELAVIDAEDDLRRECGHDR